MSSQTITNGGSGVESTTESKAADANGSPEHDDGGVESTGHEGHALSRDLIFDALKNSRRRHVLRYLDDNESQARLGELAEHIAAIENDTTTAAIDSTQRKRVYVGLYQCHLPRLDDMGIVEFDQPRGIVEAGPAAAQLEKYLAVDEDDAPWYGYHAAFTAACTLAVLLAAGSGLVGTAGGALLVMVGTSVAFASAVAARDRLR